MERGASRGRMDRQQNKKCYIFISIYAHPEMIIGKYEKWCMG
jgi:hypothetical protein